MNLREVGETYSIFEGISFLILLFAFTNESWWIASDITDLLFFGLYSRSYMG